MRILFILLTLSFFTACTYTERIKDGDTAYERKQFAVAITMLNKEYPKAKDSRERGKKAYQLAESYRRTNQYDKAAEWYEKASRERYSPDAPLKQAQMLQQAQLYDDAVSAFRTAGRDAGNANQYMEYIVASRTAKQWLAEAPNSDFKLEALSFNTAATDFSPIVLTKDEMIFTSDRAESEGKDKYKWTGQKFMDLYAYDASKDSVKRYVVTGWDAAYHQGNLVYNEDKSKVFFTQCGSDKLDGVDFCKIMMAEKSGNGWTKPRDIKLGASNINYMHPCIGPKGKYLIVSASDKKGFGGYDLYMSMWVPSEDKWSEPRNMGSAINTKGDEVFAYMDGDTLYFSSNGIPGMGGLDIYKTWQEGERWKKPENLKAPLNSGGDDFGLVMDPYGEKADTIMQMGYLTSNRKGGKGSDDIYRFMRRFPKVPEPVDTIPTLVMRLDLNGMVKENFLENPGDPNSKVSGQKPLLGATILISTADTAWSMGSDVDGSFYATVQPGKTYFFKTTKDGYFSSTDTLSTMDIVLTEENPIQKVKKEIILTPIQKGKEIVLKDVKFDYNKADIRPDAAKELDKLVDLLMKNPELNILMTSHTDCRGTDRDNMGLSQRRAESTMQYLIQKGIPGSRLQAKGFGETTPAAICECNSCTEEQHQENRRTSFVVLE